MTDITIGDVEADGEAPRKRFPGKKLVLLVGVPLLLVLLGGGAAAYFVMGGEPHGQAEGGAKPAAPKQIVFYDMPDMLVNLNTTGRQTHYLKLGVALELDDPQAIPKLEKLLPRVIDNFQVFLRELRLDDLNGSTGMMRLKEELLIRINGALPGVTVNDVLFKEMLVQ